MKSHIAIVATTYHANTLFQSSLRVLAIIMTALLSAAAVTAETLAQPPPQPKKIAAIVTSYFHNSHADVIISRLLQTDTLDGKGRAYPLKLVSLYTDQVPEND